MTSALRVVPSNPGGAGTARAPVILRSAPPVGHRAGGENHDVHALQRRGTARPLLRRLRKADAALVPAGAPGTARPAPARERRHPAGAALPCDAAPAGPREIRTRPRLTARPRPARGRSRDIAAEAALWRGFRGDPAASATGHAADTHDQTCRKRREW